jgi:hypothetical protein
MQNAKKENAKSWAMVAFFAFFILHFSFRVSARGVSHVS